jgi:hypothetical protein
MALGNVRSDGIRSLRHGEIAAPHHSLKTSFNNNLKHLLVAAELGEDDAPHILGDGLVPVQSAFGTDHFPEEHINVERIIIKETGHTRLLSDPRLYAHLRSWFDRNDIELKQTS